MWPVSCQSIVPLHAALTTQLIAISANPTDCADPANPDNYSNCINHLPFYLNRSKLHLNRLKWRISESDA